MLNKQTAKKAHELFYIEKSCYQYDYLVIIVRKVSYKIGNCETRDARSQS